MKVECRKANIEDTEVLIEIYNAAFYSDYQKYGEFVILRRRENTRG